MFREELQSIGNPLFALMVGELPQSRVSSELSEVGNGITGFRPIAERERTIADEHAERKIVRSLDQVELSAIDEDYRELGAANEVGDLCA